MRISDWSSDVCSSDLLPDLLADVPGKELALRFDHQLELLVVEPHIEQSIRGIARADALLSGALTHGSAQIGRASCRERVCQYVSISVVAVSLKKKTKKISIHTYNTVNRNI